MALVTSNAHAGLAEAIRATLPDASWQRCRTHYAANLMAATPKSQWGSVKALLHRVNDQPEADAVLEALKNARAVLTSRTRENLTQEVTTDMIAATINA